MCTRTEKNFRSCSLLVCTTSVCVYAPKKKVTKLEGRRSDEVQEAGVSPLMRNMVAVPERGVHFVVAE